MHRVTTEFQANPAVNLFYIINQDLYAGNAHALYSIRNCASLAKANPSATVWLLHTGKNRYPNYLNPSGVGGKLHEFDIHQQPNLLIKNLPSIRKPKGSIGITLNAVFYASLLFFLSLNARKGDVIITASFIKILNLLLKTRWLRPLSFIGYEVHELVGLNGSNNTSALSIQSKKERFILNKADFWITTTSPLFDLLNSISPNKPKSNLGLASTQSHLNGSNIKAKNSDSEAYEIAYIGSLYHEQGVEWLIQSWFEIINKVGKSLILRIIGGAPHSVEKIRNLIPPEIEHRFFLEGHINPSDIERYLLKSKILIIPSLNKGRMPFVAITKAYDYPAYRIPIIAADIPTISSILKNGESAFLFKPEDVDSLVYCIKKCISMPQEDLRAIVENAQKKSQEWSWEKRSSRYWEFIEKTILTASPK
jgi:glycosyltransferase involved in cell wall biosynthesis